MNGFRLIVIKYSFDEQEKTKTSRLILNIYYMGSLNVYIGTRVSLYSSNQLFFPPCFMCMKACVCVFFFLHRAKGSTLSLFDMIFKWSHTTPLSVGYIYM